MLLHALLHALQALHALPQIFYWCSSEVRALLGTTTKADSRANQNAGFTRQAGEWHWGCRINPAFRRWCQDAPDRGGLSSSVGCPEVFAIATGRRQLGKLQGRAPLVLKR